MIIKRKKLIIFLLFIINLNYSKSDMKKSWIKLSPNSLISSPSDSLLLPESSASTHRLIPSLEPDLPKFTPFDNSKIMDKIASTQEEKINEMKLKIEKYENSFVDNLSPLADYVIELYDKYRKNKRYKKFLKNEFGDSVQMKKKEEEQEDDGNVREQVLEDVDDIEEDDIDDDDADDDINGRTEETTEYYEEKEEGTTVRDLNESSEDDSKESHLKKKKILKYNVGPGVNVSLDVDKEVVRVHLDEGCLKDVFSGRGRKKDLITKTLALFILPFLIQTSFVPFLLTTIKLLLMKSVLVGKIAVLLLIIAAFKNNKARMHEVPYYMDSGSSLHRRSEEFLAAQTLDGYKVEGSNITYITN